MSYTMYTPLNVWLDPASVTDVVAYIQKYLSENTIYSETEIETIIHDYLIAHPELIGGVQSVNGKTGTVVLSASDINTANNVTIESVLASLSSQISSIAASVATNTANITNLTGRMTTAETDLTNLKSNISNIKDAVNYTECEQLLKQDDLISGSCWAVYNNVMDWSSSLSADRFPKIKLDAGITYTFIKVYAYFTWISNADETAFTRLSTNINANQTIEYTPTTDCYAYVTKAATIADAMLINNNKYFPTEYVEGVYKRVAQVETNEDINIHVKQNGTGDYTSIVDAVSFANRQVSTNTINIYIHEGDYDILDELGGQTFIDTIESSSNSRQGLVLLRNNVNLIGVGYVIMRFEMPDTVTYTQSERTSCLNLREFSNNIENLTLIAKNCRYVIHDETNGGNPNITRKMKNIRAIHKGNLSALWPYTNVLGGGAGGGSDYEFINCQFITNSYHVAFAYHTNSNQVPSHFNVDGCVGIVSASTGQSFRFAYHGTGRTGITVANVKCCSGNGKAWVTAESSSDTDNNIELYSNGYETIDQIPVTGAE